MVEQNGAEDLERFQRAAETLRKEMEQPIEWWWLSFAKPNEFLGACIVPGRGILSAQAVASSLNLNPGGEIVAAPLPVVPPDEFRLTLLDTQGAADANAALQTLYAEESTESLLEASEEVMDDVSES